MTSQQVFVKVAIHSWRLVVERADKIFSNRTEDQLLQQVAPGKNRLIYVWGHLTAIHDAMFPILGLAERLHPELDALFVSNPDTTAVQLPARRELKKYWDEVNGNSFRSLQVFLRMNGCCPTARCRRKTTPKIPPGTGWLSYSVERTICLTTWGR